MNTDDEYPLSNLGIFLPSEVAVESTVAPAEKPPEPTEEQQAFLDAVAGWDSDQERILVLTGVGGSGKTFTLARAIAAAQEDGTGVVVLSPTHQARTVLEAELEGYNKKAKETGLKCVHCKVMTVASYLGKRPDKTRAPAADGKAFFVYDSSPDQEAAENAESAQIVVVDECSMVEKDDIRRITGPQKKAGGLTIFSGDPQQLPPVSEGGGKAASIWGDIATLEERKEAKVFELTQNMRSTRQDLTDWLNEVRRTKALPGWPCPAVTLYTSREAYIAAMGEKAAEVVEKARNEKDPASREKARHEGLAALAWRNDTVRDAARALREGEGANPLWAREGDVLRVNEPVAFSTWREEYDKLRGQGMPNEEAFQRARDSLAGQQLQNGDLLEVTRVLDPEDWKPGPAAFSCSVLRARVVARTGACAGAEREVLLTRLGKDEEFHSVMASCASAIKRDGTNLEGEAWIASQRPPKVGPWRAYYYDLRDQVCVVSDFRAMTVHKAQGSGRDVVFVDWTDLAGKERDELRYTAVSRAREELHIYVGGA